MSGHDVVRGEAHWREYVEQLLSGGPGGSVSQNAANILVALADTGVNIHGAAGTSVNINWNASVNDTDQVTFTDGTAEIILDNAGQIRVHASIGIIDSAINNRSTYRMEMAHLTDLDVEIYTYLGSGAYVRDDAAQYDSGIMFGHFELNVSAGDKLIIRSIVSDTQTAAGTVNADTTLTKLKIERLTYG